MPGDCLQAPAKPTGGTDLRSAHTQAQAAQFPPPPPTTTHHTHPTPHDTHAHTHAHTYTPFIHVPPTHPRRRAEATGRTGLGKDAGKHGMMDDDISTEEAGRWKDGLVSAIQPPWFPPRDVSCRL